MSMIQGVGVWHIYNQIAKRMLEIIKSPVFLATVDICDNCTTPLAAAGGVARQNPTVAAETLCHRLGGGGGFRLLLCQRR
jgi:hypothetical protein